MSATPVVLCWDIDGTLLTTARAGVFALEKAAREVTGRPLDLQSMPTAGLTDVEIARLILTRHGLADSELNVARFLQVYEDDLPTSLHRRQGSVMPQVREVLAAVQAREYWTSMLLTGNTRRGGTAKLRHYGLAEFFSDGAFSDGTNTRAEIAHRAARQIAVAQTAVPFTRVVVIGDTRHDISCARAAGFRCLAVATGGATLDELRAHDPDAAVSQLPPPSDFIALIEEVCARA